MIPEHIVGVVLAGGQGLRLGGGDKPLRQLAGRPLLAHVLGRLTPQVDRVVLNARGDPSRFAAFGLPVVADSLADRAGPLAGILAGLDWAAAQAPGATVVTVPGDAPFLPMDLCERLQAARQRDGATIAIAASGAREHHVIGLWPTSLRDDLRIALLQEGLRKVETFAHRHSRVVVSWPCEPHDPFFNINRPEDLLAAETLLRSGP